MLLCCHIRPRPQRREAEQAETSHHHHRPPPGAPTRLQRQRASVARTPRIQVSRLHQQLGLPRPVAG